MVSLGVDACRAGWFVVEIRLDGGWSFDIFADIDGIWKQFSATASLMLVDIPIGLPENGMRTCDYLARKFLNRRASSVFAVPCRKALQAKNYKAASRINYKKSGKKLSLQSWNICSKIKEVDQLLQKVPGARRYVRESHPEVCFWALSGARPMRFNKKTSAGYLERQTVLRRLYPQSKEIIESAMSKFARKDLGKDDILDAIVLSVTASSPPQTIVTLPPKPPKDDRRFPMEIVYTNRRLNLS